MTAVLEQSISEHTRHVIAQIKGECPPTVDDVFMTPAELAVRHRVEESTLANARCRGEGIPYIKLPSGAVRYRLSDVLAAEAKGYKGFTWSRLKDALALTGMSRAERQKLVDHLKEHLC